jgi:hypothetical protein
MFRCVFASIISAALVTTALPANAQYAGPRPPQSIPPIAQPLSPPTAPPNADAKPDIPKDRAALTDTQVVGLIIAASVAAYLALNRPCACPYSKTRGGQNCGLRSAHSKPGGESPLCFPTDISPGMIAAWRKGASVLSGTQAANLK